MLGDAAIFAIGAVVTGITVWSSYVLSKADRGASPVADEETAYQKSARSAAPN